MEPTPQLLAQLRRDKIEAARRQSFAQKFLAGAELFDYACEIAKGGIRMQHPEFTDGQIMDELRRRVSIGRRREGNE
jgi:hypothetical protein